MKQKTKFKKTEIGMIPEDWEIKKLGEEINLVYGLGLRKKERKDGDYPVFGSNGIIGSHNSYIVKGPGIIIGRKGSVGKVNFSKKNFYPIDTTYYVKLKKNGSIYFWYYFLLIMNLNKMNSHAAVPGLNRNDVYILKKAIPNLKEQNSIAKILSDFDSKIELLTEQNKVLESMGQTLFKHWFVDFEFPNNKGKPYKSNGGKMKNSKLGKIPEEWKIKKIEDSFKTVSGGTPSRLRKDYWSHGNIPWVNSGKTNEFRIIEAAEYITQEALDNSSTKFLPKKTTVIAITGTTLGKISRLEIDCCINQSIIGILENKNFKSSFIYYLIKNRVDILISKQTGGAQQHINKNDINKTIFINPTNKLINKFCFITEDIMNKISINSFEIKNIKNIKNLLLPKLMNGEIRV